MIAVEAAAPSRPLRPALVVLLTLVVLIYVVGLQNAPVYLSPDEATIAVDAHALATTGRDVYGRRFPLYFQVQVTGESRMGWFTPAIFYISALFLKLLPLSEWSVRLPTACIGVIDVVLTWLIARRLFSDGRLAAVAAGMLALTPAHFMLSRYALDYLYPVPFMLAWLLCLVTFLDNRDAKLLFAAGAFLGFGFYSYIGSVVMMPLYFVMTCALLYAHQVRGREYGVAASGFAAPLTLVIPWLIDHPNAIAATVQRYELYDASRLNALQGLREFLSFPNIDRLASLYWSFFNPSFLFLSGDRSMMFSTRTVGVFLIAIAVLLPLGAWQILTERRRPVPLLILAGFVSGPAAALLGSESAAIIRATELLPFGTLLATFGVEHLWSSAARFRFRRVLLIGAIAALAVGASYGLARLWAHARVGSGAAALMLLGISASAVAIVGDRLRPGRAAAVLLLVLLPVQFGAFLADYFTGYRVRSNYWLGGNLRGALEELIDREQQRQAPRVYLAKLRSAAGLLETQNRWIDVYWKFYLIKQRREELLDRTVFIDPQYRQEVLAMPAGSLVLANLEDTTTAGLVKDGQLKLVRSIPELDRQPFFSILER